MKNFKLLLATTAILSMGALFANADDVANINVSVSIFPQKSIAVTQQPSLPTISVAEDSESVSYANAAYYVSGNNVGQLYSTNTSKVNIIGDTKDAILNVSCSYIDANDGYTALLKTPEGSSIDLSIVYTCSDDEYGKAHLKVSDLKSPNPYEYFSEHNGYYDFMAAGGGTLTGTFTVTAVYN